MYNYLYIFCAQICLRANLTKLGLNTSALILVIINLITGTWRRIEKTLTLCNVKVKCYYVYMWMCVCVRVCVCVCVCVARYAGFNTSI